MNGNRTAGGKRPAGFGDDRGRGDVAEMPARELRSVQAGGQAGDTGDSGARVRSFGELELAIMDLVWAAPRSLHPRDIQERLRPGHVVAYTTVLTVMTRLHAKGWLTREKDGRGYGYRSTVSRAEYAAGLMSQALAIGGDDAATLAYFASRLSPSDRQQFRDLLPGRQSVAHRRADRTRPAPHAAPPAAAAGTA